MHRTTTTGAALSSSFSPPQELELTLLCLDYLRDLRRSIPPATLATHHGLDADRLTLAIWALQQAFVVVPTAPQNQNNPNQTPWSRRQTDAWRRTTTTTSSTITDLNQQQQQQPLSNELCLQRLPTLAAMEQEVLWLSDRHPHRARRRRRRCRQEEGENDDDGDEEDEYEDDEDDEKDEADEKKLESGEDAPKNDHHYHDYSWNDDYDDSHPSNHYRYYTLCGLQPPPLTLGELVAAGLVGLAARSRQAATQDLVTRSQLFQQFLLAVQKKGFFLQQDDSTFTNASTTTTAAAVAAIPPDRMQKVVDKFRNKLLDSGVATREYAGLGDATAMAAAEQQKQTRQRLLWMLRQQQQQQQSRQQTLTLSSANATQQQQREQQGPLIPTASSLDSHSKKQPPLQASRSNQSHSNNHKTTQNQGTVHPTDLEQAEKLKHMGNAFMQRKEYDKAADCYTQALQLSPHGPYSHVYYSNRAAALVSMKQFQEAVLDSERSLALKPDYGKAHARLGLAHFLLGNYRPALEAYTVALKYEPNNKSSKNYLEKAARRLAEGRGGGGGAMSLHHHLTAADGTGTNSKEAFDGDLHSASLLQPSFSVVSEWAEKSHAGGGGGGSVASASNNKRHTPVNKMATTPVSKGETSKNKRFTTDEREAEKFKVQGNSFMSNREYEQALKAYTQALERSPCGSQSHVYYSNRAAALCYLERYEDAEKDSLQSLSLCPTYGKAHARLGLSRFFLQDYAGAVAAYTAALKFDPDNAASKSYLQKAKAKLEAIQGAAARRMMEDPEMRSLAAKVMNDPGRGLLHDPDMQNMARKAINDPNVKAFMSLMKE